MSTPEIDSEIAKSNCVTCRAQPPFWMRFGALLNDAQNIGMSLTSVGGGDCAEGNCPASGGFRGPGSLVLAELPRVLTAPRGGSSGLPKLAARAAVSALATPLAASMVRREITGLSSCYRLSDKSQFLVLSIVKLVRVPEASGSK